MNDKKSTVRWGRSLAIGFAAAAIIAVALLAGRHYLGTGTTTQAAPAIGGPFTLVDQRGRTVADTDLHGRFLLIYFGYTFCPDVCPTSLVRNTEALEMLGSDAEAIVPVFITVDPERDTPEVMNDYADFFHPRMIALTGSEEQVAAAAKAYRVYFSKVQEPGADADDYLVDHTSITYLMGRDGRFVTHFRHDMGPEAMAEKLRELL